MKTEFTKGGWHVFLDTIQTNNGGKIAEVCTENDTCKNNWEANAKLIAAAPDMLNALEKCIAMLRAMGYKNGEVCQESIKVIKKATQ